MVDLPLSDLRVLEITQGIAGPFCGKLLAEFGAQVIKVEPLCGDSARHQGPFAHDRPDPEGSLLFLYVNTAKRSITLEIPCRTGQRLLEALATHADVLITDQSATLSPSLGLSPRLIQTSIRPYGLTGPDADRPATELTLEAMGGVMAIVGDPDRWPPQLPDRHLSLSGWLCWHCSADSPAMGGPMPPGRPSRVARRAALYGRRAAGRLRR